jgi:hypothetical protein
MYSISRSVRFLILLTVFELLPKRAILPYVLFLVTAAMFVGPMETNEEFLIEDLTIQFSKF